MKQSDYETNSRKRKKYRNRYKAGGHFRTSNPKAKGQIGNNAKKS